MKSDITLFHIWYSGIGEQIMTVHAFLRIADFIKSNSSKRYNIKYVILPFIHRTANSDSFLKFALDEENIKKYVDEFDIIKFEFTQDPVKWFKDKYGYISLDEAALESFKENNYSPIPKCGQTHSWEETVFLKTDEDLPKDDIDNLAKFIREEIYPHPLLQGQQNYTGISNTSVNPKKIIHPRVYEIALNFCKNNELELYNFTSIFARIRYEYEELTSDNDDFEQININYIQPVIDWCSTNINSQDHQFISSNSFLFKKSINQGFKNTTFIDRLDLAFYKKLFISNKKKLNSNYNLNVPSIFPKMFFETEINRGTIADLTVLNEVMALIELIIMSYSKSIIQYSDSFISLFLWYPATVHNIPIYLNCKYDQIQYEYTEFGRNEI